MNREAPHSPLEAFAQRALELLIAWWPAKAVGGLLLTLFGPWNEQYTTLLALNALDFALGVAVGVKTGRLRSYAASHGLFYKTLQWVAVLVAYRIDKGLGVSLVHTLMVGGLIVAEAISVLENLQILSGNRIPVLGRILGDLKDKQNKYLKGGDKQ
ncbi:phage holin family protein [Calidithermus chliarophilus]|uniref:phage holin family protein n=1 Tax=Calidithermus chliarophilus TaxID=52023 RepID=UPI0003F4F3E7|nr:phage holin family protein [Calidithermus chliarophilus]